MPRQRRGFRPSRTPLRLTGEDWDQASPREPFHSTRPSKYLTSTSGVSPGHTQPRSICTLPGLWNLPLQSPQHSPLALPPGERTRLTVRQGHSTNASGSARVVYQTDRGDLIDVPRDGKTIGEISVWGNLLMRGVKRLALLSSVISHIFSIS